MHDVIVAGLGGMGSAAAYQLAGRGSACSGWRGSPRPTTEAPATAARASSARPTSRTRPTSRCCCAPTSSGSNWNGRQGSSLMTLTGGLMIGRQDSEPFSGSMRSAEEYGLPYEILDAAEIRRRFPAYDPGPETPSLSTRRRPASSGPKRP